eukprot:gnl/TRDRNA2_/TRDRNA2_204115_c0_seq1.p1 gnl/TRDRNA2_/TRDRNA2_204115_c0~~gnl/TRDRNA2_/TRDRNA2_204115_c0_seq1.p1  ORF type:complete len:150 (+),score=13.21 gnl/TRDRNA2_/TRDRNA2_204115_c0_seq1:292-741(+)
MMNPDFHSITCMIDLCTLPEWARGPRLGVYSTWLVTEADGARDQDIHQVPFFDSIIPLGHALAKKARKAGDDIIGQYKDTVGVTRIQAILRQMDVSIPRQACRCHTSAESNRSDMQCPSNQARAETPRRRYWFLLHSRLQLDRCLFEQG